MSTAVYEYKRAKTRQRGVAAVELALVAIPFFLMFLGAIEFGRLMYVWATVQEVTRNAARQVVVTDFNNSTAIAAIKNSAVFRSTAGSLPAAPEITNSQVTVRYLNAAGNLSSPRPLTPGDNIAACLDSTRTGACIRYVEVCISTDNTCSPSGAISFSPMIGFFSTLSALTIPLSTVRMPAESLGFVP